MLQEVCISCRRPKATLSCEICQDFVCKECVQFLEASTFSFLRNLPEELSHTYYCSPCYDAEVDPQLQSYNEVMERARSLYFFFNTQRRPVPVLKKSKETARVDNCEDRDETILRLAFIAAENGFNAIVEAEITSKKVRDEGYEKSSWSGIGTPAQVDVTRLERTKS